VWRRICGTWRKRRRGRGDGKMEGMRAEMSELGGEMWRMSFVVYAEEMRRGGWWRPSCGWVVDHHQNNFLIFSFCFWVFNYPKGMGGLGFKLLLFLFYFFSSFWAFLSIGKGGVWGSKPRPCKWPCTGHKIQ
jgi:hypothetical protein